MRRQFLYTDTLLVTGCLSKFVVNSLGFGRCGNNFNSVISEHMLQIKFMTTVVLWGECHRTSLMISQHWFRYWLGAVRQQANTWLNVDTDLCHHMASLGHNELKHGRSRMVKRHWAMLVHLCMSPPVSANVCGSDHYPASLSSLYDQKLFSWISNFGYWNAVIKPG